MHGIISYILKSIKYRYYRVFRHMMRNKIRACLSIHDEYITLRDVRFPRLSSCHDIHDLYTVLPDTFFSYLFMNDNYDEDTVEYCDNFLHDGLYGLKNKYVDVTVEPGDVVIDAGAWIGDFSAYAAIKGANVYAFEPTSHAYDLLCQTAKLNGNIVPVNKALWNTVSSIYIHINGIESAINAHNQDIKSSEIVDTTTLDAFVQQMNIKVDFIKADIEGGERQFLMGAQSTLQKYAPKLTISAYHKKDDPLVLPELIKNANPNYNIVLKRMKLYASVPGRRHI